METNRKVIYIWLIAGIALGILGFFYIQNVLIPVRLKNFLAQKIENTLHKPVTISGISFRLIDGLIIKDLTVFNDNSRKTHLFKADEISFNVLFLPFIKGQTIVVPSLLIKHPDILIIKTASGQTNLANFIDQAFNAHLPQQRFSFFIRKVRIKNGSVIYQDQSLDPILTQKIDRIDLMSNIGIDRKIHFTANINDAKHDSQLKLNGTYGLKDHLLFSWVHAENLPLAQYLAMVHNSTPLKFRDGTIDSADAELTFQNNIFLLKGNAALKNLDLQLSENKNISGSIKLEKFSLALGKNIIKTDGALTFDSLYIILDAQNDVNLSGRININSGEFKGPNVNIKGDLSFNNISCRVEGNQFLQTDLRSQSYVITSIPQGIVVTGDLSSENSFIKMTMDKIIHTSLKADYATFNLKNNQTELNTDLKLSIKNALFKGLFQAGGDMTTDNFHFLSSPNGIAIDSQLSGKSMNIKLNNNMTLSDEIFLAFNASKKGKTLDYSGAIEFKHGKILNVPYIDHVTGLSGKINFTADSLSSDNLKFNTLNTNAVIKGEINGFNEPCANLTITSEDINFEDLTDTPFLNKTLSPFISKLSGHSGLQIAYNGALNQIDPDQLSFKFVLDNVKVSSPHIPAPISELSGRIAFSKDLLSWDNLKGTYLNHWYALDGKVVKFSRPTLTTSIRSQDLNIDTELKILHSAFQFAQFRGHWFNSSLFMQGDVHFTPHAAPDIDVRMDFNLNTTDLKKFTDAYSLKPLPIDIKGMIKGDGLYRGKLNDWRNWQLVLNCSSSKLWLNTHPFENLALRYEQRERNINKFDLTGTIYDGQLSVKGTADLRTDDLPAKVQLGISNMDLETYNKSQETKFKFLSGTLNAFVDLTTLPLSQLDAAKGTGFFKISDGLLGQFIPEIDQSYFTNANGNFVMRDGGMITKDTMLYGERVSIKAVGKMNFDQKLNFMLYPEYHAILDNMTPYGDNPNAGQTFKHILNIKVAGTLAHPQFTPTISASKTIKGTADAIKNGLGTILQEIF
ncbi:MAG: DUF748 domain-containing protein [Candidatus Omnitrophica bacterium]|nr:DUF748 domain-containing protein [Candidatus Omnitrophota bacterium]